MLPCKHLDHNEANYPTCTLITLEQFSVQVKHWRRNEVPYAGAPVNVQFCGAGRGRINGIFQCYNAGEMPCYETAEQTIAAAQHPEPAAPAEGPPADAPVDEQPVAAPAAAEDFIPSVTDLVALVSNEYGVSPGTARVWLAMRFGGAA